MEDLEQGIWHALGALTLCFLPNLEQIEIQLNNGPLQLSSRNWIDVFFAMAKFTQREANALLQKLEVISLNTKTCGGAQICNKFIDYWLFRV